MSPRAYDLGKRSVDVAKTRARIIGSARSLLASSTSFAQVSIPAIAREADVARDTVYRQFASRSGLLEAVFDDSANRSGLSRLAEAGAAPDAVDGLMVVATVFCHYWSDEFPIHRALRALAGLDVDLSEALRRRDGRRRQILDVLCGRLATERPDLAPVRAEQRERTVELLLMLTSFAAYAQLVPDRSPDEVHDIVQRGFRDVLHLPET
jgi:AcrR family transcriptional regulator